MFKRVRFFVFSILAMMIVTSGIIRAEDGFVVLNQKSKTYSKRVAVTPGQTLVIEGKPFKAKRSFSLGDLQADITIDGADVHEISAKMVLEVKDSDAELLEKFLESSELILVPNEQGYRLSVETPLHESPYWKGGTVTRFFRKIFKGRESGISLHTDIKITLPSRFSLDIDNAFGDIQIRNVTGVLTVNNSSGEVWIDQCGGELDLRNSFAPADVRDFDGPVLIKNSSGEVSLARIGGKAEVDNSFKPVHFRQIDGSLIVDSQSADVMGDQVKGNCMITSSFKEVKVRDIQGRLEIKAPSCRVTARNIDQDAVIESSFKSVHADSIRGELEVTCQSSAVIVDGVDGDVRIQTSFREVQAEHIGGTLTIKGESCAVTVNDIEKDVVIQTSFNPIRVRGVKGNLDVKGGSCSVSIEDIDGDVEISNSFRDVVVKGSSGSIDIVGESSSIEVSEIKKIPQNAHFELETTFKPVTLILPEDANVSITAKTTFGKIRSVFPVYLDEEDVKRVRVQRGDGSIPVRISTSSDIIIKND